VLDTFTKRYVLMYEHSDTKWNLILLGTVFIPPIVALLIGMALFWAISGFKAL
jgi:hypothetical protein